MRQEDAEDLQKKIMSAKFDFNDFLKQTRAVAKMGSMTRVLGMIPGMGKVSPAQIREAEKNLLVMEAMIEVMTPGISSIIQLNKQKAFHILDFGCLILGFKSVGQRKGRNQSY